MTRRGSTFTDLLLFRGCFDGSLSAGIVVSTACAITIHLPLACTLYVIYLCIERASQ